LNKIYASWYCGDDACTWSTEPKFENSAWLTNRGDGKPTINIVIFAFINPTNLLRGEIPAGFTQNAVNYFTSKNMYVMFSIGGESYSGNWDSALASNPTQLAQNAAAIARKFNVGIEIDYETDSATSLPAMETFVKTYRSIIPQQNGDTPSPPSLLTVDLGAGTGYLSALSAKAGGWLTANLINWVYAMVSGDPNGDNTAYWQQHLNGATWANIPPVPAQKLVGCLYASSNANNCKNYDGTVLPTAISFVESHNMKGISFWSSGCPAPNNCVTGCPGIEQGSKVYLG